MNRSSDFGAASRGNPVRETRLCETSGNFPSPSTASS